MGRACGFKLLQDALLRLLRRDLRQREDDRADEAVNDRCCTCAVCLHHVVCISASRRQPQFGRSQHRLNNWRNCVDLDRNRHELLLRFLLVLRPHFRNHTSLCVLQQQATHIVLDERIGDKREDELRDGRPSVNPIGSFVVVKHENGLENGRGCCSRGVAGRGEADWAGDSLRGGVNEMSVFTQQEADGTLGTVAVVNDGLKHYSRFAKQGLELALSRELV